jgi:arylsulfate sulfotransferase
MNCRSLQCTHLEHFHLRRFHNPLGLGAFFVCILMASGCGYVQSGPNPVAQAITISVTPVSASVQVGGAVKFNSTVRNTSNTTVTWWVNGVLGGDATHGLIDPTGMYTAPAAPPVPATVSIKVVSSAAPSMTATATVIVQPQVITVAVSPSSAVVLAGQIKQFTATVTGDTTGVMWSVNGIAGGNSTIGPIDSLGNYTGPAVTQNIAVTITATSKKDPSKSASVSVTVIAPQIVVTLSPQSTVLIAGQVTQFKATVTGDTTGVVWSVNGTKGGNSTVGTIDSAGGFTAPLSMTNTTATVNAASKADPTKAASASVTIIASGLVASTANVQVALYTITPPSGASASIQFGPDTNYGLTTWLQPAPSDGGPVNILVAGMRLNNIYHMRAVLTLADGSEINDVDHSFTTGDLPSASMPVITASTAPGLVPQSGVELLDLVGNPTKPGVVVADLEGNIIWYYNPGLTVGEIANPIKLLPNGRFLINFSLGAPDGGQSVLQEVDLSGRIIWQMTAAELNQALAAASCTGCNITVVGTHHDFIPLPNGHLIVLASDEKLESGLIGYPDPIIVTGDVIIDLDESHKPVWVWSTFDHLDLNRHPMAFTDWTHSNAIIYSPNDKSLILSMRHQDWVIKIDYNDGQGAGDILWKLGYQGDFVLQSGTDPQDWFYAQHDINIIGPDSDGIFQILLFDNGNQRVLDSEGTICGTSTPCTSRVPILQLDETNKTATVEWVDNLGPTFSNFGGSARLLKNGNVEFAECAPNTQIPTIYEVTKTAPPQVVWQLHAGQNIYRGFRIPSLYPGVQW